MPKGYVGVILRVDLSANTIEKVEFPEEFYRTYMGGGAVGAYFLLKERITRYQWVGVVVCLAAIALIVV